ncbi:hypothetical protein [Cryptosporangium phraense]|uniref:DUF2188 domain-containing protein n=1 Tax=Cryptosporangium phraense TaxID=2593070 RepID=A0A545ATB6_9ACTN|nr:hypothetical protein [Cryptosporangium phraense]TQS44552.1 hypothetical protein FL583_13920 [Cryptosporangium phraense]
MTWQWRYQGNTGGGELGEVSEEFPSQSDAESWLGEEWRQLSAAGVDQVTLEENGRVEYAMPLTND